MITKMHIENFKCFKDFDIELGPFNVLIGPNDSGKTAFLEAIRVAFSPLGETVHQVEERIRKIGLRAFWREEDSSGFTFSLETSPETDELDVKVCYDKQIGLMFERSYPGRREKGPSDLGKSACFRFNPRSLRNPSELVDNLGEDGTGLAAVLMAVATAHPDEYRILRDYVRTRFKYELSPKVPPQQKKAALFF
jgi:predicted ATPase